MEDPGGRRMAANKRWNSELIIAGYFNFIYFHNYFSPLL